MGFKIVAVKTRKLPEGVYELVMIYKKPLFASNAKFYAAIRTLAVAQAESLSNTSHYDMHWANSECTLIETRVLFR